ncbi:MAG: VanZ family protein [Candidatus Marinimicrobia bacterium]|nr:VanZ family protein [Candidatus Neomarinimicrobiota bacterium]
MVKTYRNLFYSGIILVTLLSLLPNFGNVPTGSIVPLFSKGYVQHIVAYFFLTVLFIKSYKIKKFKNILITSCGLLLYSVLLESVQYFLPYRTFNPIDGLANMAGIFIAVGGGFLRHKICDI